MHVRFSPLLGIGMSNPIDAFTISHQLVQILRVVIQKGIVIAYFEGPIFARWKGLPKFTLQLLQQLRPTMQVHPLGDRLSIAERSADSKKIFANVSSRCFVSKVRNEDTISLAVVSSPSKFVPSGPLELTGRKFFRV